MVLTPSSRAPRSLRASAAARRASLLLAMSMLLGSCADSPTAPKIGPPAAIQIGSGNGQTAIVSTTLAAPFQVELIDARGRPVPLALVRWNVTLGSGTMSPESSYTNVEGIARAFLTTGSAAGDQRVEASYGALTPVVFSATAVRRPLAQLVAVSGGNQSVRVGEALPEPLVVLATDELGFPLPDITINFSSSNGVVAPANVVTNAEGIAAAQWTMPIRAGYLTARARVLNAPNVSAAEFTAEARPIPADTVLVLTGAGQVGAIRTALATPITVRVLDLTGAPIPQHYVSFLPSSGGGTAPFTVLTNPQGEASTIWELGGTVGEQTLTIRSSSEPSDIFTILKATATPGPATQVTLLSGGDQSAGRGEALPFPIVISARDAYDNPVTGTAVTFTAGAGFGSFTPAIATTDSLGRATVSWTLGNTLGMMTATASVAGGASLALQAQATPSLYALDHEVVDAAYHASSNRLVTVSSMPARLRIIDPDTRATSTVVLPIPATALAISPDGATAAVGHDGFVSEVNLNTGVLIQTIPIGMAVGTLVLTGDRFVFGVPRVDQWQPITSLNLATGAIRTSALVYAGSRIRLHPSGDFLYGNSTGWLEKYDIRDDTAALVTRRSSTSQSPGVDLWLSANGDRIYGQTANVFTTSADTSLDMRYLTRLFGVFALTTVAHSEATQRVAAFEVPSWNQLPPSSFRVYAEDFLAPLGAVSLPRFAVENVGMVRGEGRFAFFSASGALHVLLYVPAAPSITARWGLTTYAAADLP